MFLSPSSLFNIFIVPSSLFNKSQQAYDGRGNAVVKSEAILEQAFRHLGGKDSGESELYAERWVPFTKELAVMVRISFPLTLLSIAHVFIYVFLY
jgi:phosphoribosylaminoimidazole carboxylase (NCAIR synthetase)